MTDGNGRYAVDDLRPGTYTVTFTLPGFKTVKREGIVLEGASLRRSTRRCRSGPSTRRSR